MYPGYVSGASALSRSRVYLHPWRDWFWGLGECSRGVAPTPPQTVKPRESVAASKRGCSSYTAARRATLLHKCGYYSLSGYGLCIDFCFAYACRGYGRPLLMSNSALNLYPPSTDLSQGAAAKSIQHTQMLRPGVRGGLGFVVGPAKAKTCFFFLRSTTGTVQLKHGEPDQQLNNGNEPPQGERRPCKGSDGPAKGTEGPVTVAGPLKVAHNPLMATVPLTVFNCQNLCGSGERLRIKILAGLKACPWSLLSGLQRRWQRKRHVCFVEVWPSPPGLVGGMSLSKLSCLHRLPLL